MAAAALVNLAKSAAFFSLWFSVAASASVSGYIQSLEIFNDWRKIAVKCDDSSTATNLTGACKSSIISAVLAVTTTVKSPYGLYGYALCPTPNPELYYSDGAWRWRIWSNAGACNTSNGMSATTGFSLSNMCALPLVPNSDFTQCVSPPPPCVDDPDNIQPLFWQTTITSYNGTTVRVAQPEPPAAMCKNSCTWVAGGPQSDMCYGSPGFPVGSAIYCQGNYTQIAEACSPTTPNAVALPSGLNTGAACPAGEVATIVDGVSSCVAGKTNTTGTTSTTTTNPDGSTTTDTRTTGPNGSVSSSTTTTSADGTTTETMETTEGPADSGFPSQMGEGVELPIADTARTISLSPVSLGAGSCPAPVTITAGGRTFTMPLIPYCTLAEAIRPIVILLSWFSAGWIVLGGAKK